jgi:hypothetical protein
MNADAIVVGNCYSVFSHGDRLVLFISFVDEINECHSHKLIVWYLKPDIKYNDDHINATTINNHISSIWNPKCLVVLGNTKHCFPVVDIRFDYKYLVKSTLAEDQHICLI